MRKVAYLTSANLIGWNDEIKRADNFEHQLQFDALRTAGAKAGFHFEEICWEDPRDLSAFDLAIVGTTWDYWDKRTQFLDRLDDISHMTKLLNPAATIAWNMDKSYLDAFAQKGVKTIPTHYSGESSLETCLKIMDRFGWEKIVVKPQIGAGAWRQFIWQSGENFPSDDDRPPQECLIQPFIETVQSDGEISVIILGRSVSHAVCKVPKAGDYRVQSLYGGCEHVVEIDQNLQQKIDQVLDAVEHDFLHARIDLIPDGQGSYYLIELELIEPYLYPEQSESLGRSYINALSKKI